MARRRALQGMSAGLQPWAAQAMSHAAGRYGHVMFPENVYEPVLECAEKLLRLVGGSWASKVFFSDDGWVQATECCMCGTRAWPAAQAKKTLRWEVAEPDERQVGHQHLQVRQQMCPAQWLPQTCNSAWAAP